MGKIAQFLVKENILLLFTNVATIKENITKWLQKKYQQKWRLELSNKEQQEIDEGKIEGKRI